MWSAWSTTTDAPRSAMSRFSLLDEGDGSVASRHGTIRASCPLAPHPLVLLGRIGVGKRAVIVDRNLSGRGSVCPNHALRPCGRIRTAEGLKQRAVDQHGMAVLNPSHRAYDRRARLVISIDHGADRSGAHERDIYQRHERRDDAGSINHRQAGEERRKLPLLVVEVLDETRLEIAGRKSFNN